MKKLLVSSTAAILGAAALALIAAPGSHHVTGANTKRPDAAFVARAHALFTKYMSSHASVVLPGVRGVSKIQPEMAKVANGSVTTVPTVNWSGYADVEATSSQTFTKVSGSWIIPAVQCLSGAYRNQDAFLSQWVGLDGATDSTVEQLGSGTQCYEGVEFYYVWYEMFPAGMVEMGTTACINDNVNCPQPGDRISASVTVTPGASGENNYSLSLTDHTRPQESFAVAASCATTTCLDSSAEWIIERPAFFLPAGFQFLPLSDYGQTLFTAGDQTSDGQSASIGGFQGGPVFDVQLIDDSGGYYLDCVGQRGQPGSLLLTTDSTACPVASPFRNGAFLTTWDSSF